MTVHVSFLAAHAVPPEFTGRADAYIDEVCLPALRAVAFNGGASAKLGLKILAGRRDLALIPLPSSSPAHTLRFARKLEAWGPLAAYLD